MSFYSKFTTTALVSMLAMQSAHAENNFLTNGDFFGEIRYRYEFVDQNGINNNAHANTVRTNLGYKTGEIHGITGLVEGQLVQHIGGEKFNSLENNNTTYPVVADPDVVQLNRAWLNYNGVPQTNIKLGRQAINWDGQRFIGTVGWRQNDQTFDALTVSNDSLENIKIKYGYIHNVNRIFGDSSPAEDLESQSHIANVSYNINDRIVAKAYGYLLDFEDALGLSSETYGVSLSGNMPVTEILRFKYHGEYAHQNDHAENPSNYDESYYHINAALDGKSYSFKIGHEVLGGDGTNSFQTPLATLHKFNGWTDKFLSTPVSGLKDTYVGMSYKLTNTASSLLNGTKLSAVYHNFQGDSSGDYGSEIDFSISKKFKLPENQMNFNNINVLLKYADYDGKDAPYTDTQKLWLQIGTKF
jgi:hypothetical protein